jgi:ribosomal protein L22
MVRDIWTNTIVGRTPMERWQGKIHRLRKHLRGWEKHKWPLKREKEILNTLDSLDKKAENILLQLDELNLKQCLNNRLAHMLHEEEIKWYQRTKVKELLEGDSNTRGRP